MVTDAILLFDFFGLNKLNTPRRQTNMPGLLSTHALKALWLARLAPVPMLCSRVLTVALHVCAAAALPTKSELKNNTFHILQPPSQDRARDLASGCLIERSYMSCFTACLSPVRNHHLASCEDGTGCGLGDDYEFVVRIPEDGPNEQDMVIEFFGGGALL